MHPVTFIWSVLSVGFVWMMITQLLIPAWTDTPFFPALRRSAVKRDAEESLADAKRELKSALTTLKEAQAQAGGDIREARRRKHKAEEIVSESKRKAKRLGVIVEEDE